MTYPDVLVVEVTAEDIREGARVSCTTCPIARAASRTTGAPAWVAYTHIQVAAPGLFSTNDAARRFINDFDAGRPVEPQTFRFERFE